MGARYVPLCFSTARKRTVKTKTAVRKAFERERGDDVSLYVSLESSCSVNWTHLDEQALRDVDFGLQCRHDQ